MVRFQDPPQENHRDGADGTYPSESRFNDMASFVTDTSSITNPAELGFSFSDEDQSSATSALTGLTGWTSAMGGVSGVSGGLGAVSELSESQNFPVAHSKSNKSAYTTEDMMGEDEMEAVSNGVSAISFDMDGSVEASLEEAEDMMLPRIRSKNSNSRSKSGRRQVETVGPAKAVQFRTPSESSRSRSKGNAYGNNGGVPPSISPTSSTLSKDSNASKKRAPVPQMRDPNMDDTEEDQMWEEDCNYDINPTLMYLVLENRDWKEAIALLDGKGLENKDDAWNLGSLFGGGKKKPDPNVMSPHSQLTQKRKNELRAQARTWIIRRERNGVLRWRMLPLHASLAFNAPFEVVLRLYHLYPGAVRCRNDQGMLPLHHCFKFGNEDKVLELLLDVFPEALTVLDDRGRLPLACTTEDGSDNERRSNILTLFSNFQVDLALSMMKTGADDDANAAADAGIPQRNALPAEHTRAAAAQKKVDKLQSNIEPLSPTPTSPNGTLGAAPRYTAHSNYNPVTFNAIKPPPPPDAPVATVAPVNKRAEAEQAPIKAPPAMPTSPKEDSDGDRYAMLSGEDGENNPTVGNVHGRLGLSTIIEEGDSNVGVLLSPRKDVSSLKLELLALGEKKKKKKGLRKLFSKKRTTLSEV